MPNAYILARFSHGNEPIFIAMNIAAHLMRSDPNLDLVLPAPESKAGLIREIADGRGIARGRVYIDSVAADLASAYGVYWENGMDYFDWVVNNLKNMHIIDSMLTEHYKRFWPRNLEGEENHFRDSKARMVLNAGDLYDQLGLDAPRVYAFPLRHSEVLKRSKKAGLPGFGQVLRERERTRNINFIPTVHSLGYDVNYEPLENEETTPHMKEEPIASDIALPDNSIAMVFSGTGRKIETLKRVAAATKHPVVTGAFAGVGGDGFVKIAPPRAEFVHVYADPRIKAVVGQAGYGMLWGAWNADKPVVFPAYEEGDDEEFIHNARTIKKFGLGVEIKKPEDIDAAVEAAGDLRAIRTVNNEIIRDFGTMDGPAYIARRIRELGLY